MTQAVRWLKANHAEKPFYLHVEAFDPHEPWDPPARFLEQYLPGAKGPTLTEPPYGDIQVPEEIKKRFRANYAGETTCVDYWIGRVLETIDELGLFDNSIVIFTADHGALLGEQGQFLKGPTRLRGQVTHVPLLVRLPGKQYAGKRVSGFVDHTDLMPSALHLLGLKPPSRVTGNNIWPLVTGQTKALRDYVVQTYGWIGAVRTHEWNYSQIWKPEAKQEPYQPQLYNLEKDPEELVDVAEKYPDVGRELAAKLREYIASGEGITNGSFHGKESLDASTVYVSTAR
jgi:arylsulfatase A-like enzyme